MAVEPCSLSERELRLGEIAVAYLKELEEGRAPDRHQLLARYPEFAAELAEFLAGQEEVDRVAGPLREAVRPTVAQAGLQEDTPRTGPGPWPPAEGRSFGDYELLEVIGQGGMGVVYRARQKSLNRLVALKMMRAGELPAEVRRFRNEAELAANLDHPHIVPVHEVGEHEGRLYLSLKLMEGGSLAERADRLPADPGRAARLVATVARAVHYAHQRGILHRDLKPGNILVDAAGQLHVTDFGLARRVEGDSSLTQSGALVGTPSYMGRNRPPAKRAWSRRQRTSTGWGRPCTPC
jgi:serine/threonine-protein kinase